MNTKTAQQEVDKLALYRQKKDKEPISNALDITIPEGENAMNADYKPSPISLSTIKAVQIDDEKDENVYVYFEAPEKIRGEDIEFKIKYIDDDNKESKSISSPIIIPKSSISTIDDKQYESEPSDIISIDYPKPLSIMIDYIHSDDDPIKIEFVKNTEFDDFKQIIVDKLELNENENGLRIGYISGQNKIITITNRNFNAASSMIDISADIVDEHIPSTTLCVGFDPKVPIIQHIDIETKGQFRIKLKSKLKNTCCFDMESEEKEHEITLNPNITKTMDFMINDINPTSKYKLRVKAMNKFGESEYSEWTKHIQQIKQIEPENKDKQQQKLSHFIQITEIVSLDQMIKQLSQSQTIAHALCGFFFCMKTKWIFTEIIFLWITLRFVINFSLIL